MTVTYPYAYGCTLGELRRDPLNIDFLAMIR
jgi:hypothetical protein